MSLQDDRCTSKPGMHLKPIEIRAYPPDSKLCVVSCLNAYPKVTPAFDTMKRLYLSHGINPTNLQKRILFLDGLKRF